MALLLPQLSRPSYQQGYARSQGESANSGLWRGLAGAWMPSFGPTGLTVFDASGRGNNGTLANMTLDDWVPTENGYALDFDSNNDEVQTDLLLPASPKSVSCLARLNSGQAVEILWSTTQGGSFGLLWNQGAGGWNFQHGVPVTDFDWDEDNDWHVITATWDGTTAFLYIDGESLSEIAISGAVNPTRAGFTVGGRGSSAGWGGQIASCLTYDRILTFNEHLELYQDPSAPFRRKVFFPVGELAAAEPGQWEPYLKKPLRRILRPVF